MDSKSFKEILNEKEKQNIKPQGIVTDIEKIKVVAEDATLEEAEKIWPVLEASLDSNIGYGLAAIQIGIPKKVAIINYNGRIYRLRNTHIVETGPKDVVYNEGCLSIPGKIVHTERFTRLTIQDATLGELELNMSKDGLLPVIFQHEIDHFEGKTIFDHKRHPIVVEKIGRNSPCPCGSGKKYKKCCQISNYSKSR